MRTTEEPIDAAPARERGSSKLLAVWGHRGQAAGASTDWMALLRSRGGALQSPRLVVSGAAMSGLSRPASLAGATSA